eukprot:6318412-Prymnesium_polylepis.1
MCIRDSLHPLLWPRPPPAPILPHLRARLRAHPIDARVPVASWPSAVRLEALHKHGGRPDI